MKTTEQPRLAAVDAVRAVQREWIAHARAQAAAGGNFAICNGDEAEEIFLNLDIPVVAINYWNLLILAQKKGRHFSEVLNRCGYPGQHMFALGLGSSIEPADAPWGGLPQPTIIVGSSRSESEMRICELWAQETQAHFFPMDFSFPSEHFRPLPPQWWTWTKNRWQELVEPRRLDFRVQQEHALIRFCESLTGRDFSISQLSQSLQRINSQMAAWGEARQLIAAAPICPVHIRDQMSFYQAMWHRGTERGIEMTQCYRDEIRERVDVGTPGYRHEHIRFHYSGDTPPWLDWAEETFGAVAVSNFYSGVPELYERTIFDADPVRTLAGRHLFLFAYDPAFALHQAQEHRCDAVVVVEPNQSRYGPAKSREQSMVEAAGMRYLALPRHADDAEIRSKVAACFAA